MQRGEHLEQNVNWDQVERYLANVNGLGGTRRKNTSLIIAFLPYIVKSHNVRLPQSQLEFTQLIEKNTCRCIAQRKKKNCHSGVNLS